MIMTREEEIISTARKRAERHQIAEMELYKGDKCNYSYSRIHNAEIASFEAGAKWADNHPKSPWISVEDDLPCDFPNNIHFGFTNIVLAETSNNDYIVGCMAKIGDNWKWRVYRNSWVRLDSNTSITYWMPIPKLQEDQS